VQRPQEGEEAALALEERHHPVGPGDAPGGQDGLEPRRGQALEAPGDGPHRAVRPRTPVHRIGPLEVDVGLGEGIDRQRELPPPFPGRHLVRRVEVLQQEDAPHGL
jgi:hypothetical protein